MAKKRHIKGSQKAKKELAKNFSCWSEATKIDQPACSFCKLSKNQS